MSDSSFLPDPLTPGRIAREPVVATNVLAALILEICVLLRQFGVPLTDGQQAAINSVAGLLILIGAALIARRFTTSLVAPKDHLGRALTPDDPASDTTGTSGGNPIG